jgi:uncharacterized protein YaaW (UPF0174 family)
MATPQKKPKKPNTAADAAPKPPAAWSKPHRDGRLLKLTFRNADQPELHNIEFRYSGQSLNKGYGRDSLTPGWRWGPIQQALSLLFLDYVYPSSGKAVNDFVFHEIGIASSLYNACHKSSGLIKDLFRDIQLGREEESCLRAVMDVRKISGSHCIVVNSDFLPVDCVNVLWDACGAEPLPPASIERLSDQIRHSLGMSRPKKNVQSTKGSIITQAEELKKKKDLVEPASTELPNDASTPTVHSSSSLQKELGAHIEKIAKSVTDRVGKWLGKKVKPLRAGKKKPFAPTNKNSASKKRKNKPSTKKPEKKPNTPSQAVQKLESPGGRRPKSINKMEPLDFLNEHGRFEDAQAFGRFLGYDPVVEVNGLALKLSQWNYATAEKKEKRTLKGWIRQETGFKSIVDKLIGTATPIWKSKYDYRKILFDICDQLELKVDSEATYAAIEKKIRNKWVRRADEQYSKMSPEKKVEFEKLIENQLRREGKWLSKSSLGKGLLATGGAGVTSILGAEVTAGIVMTHLSFGQVVLSALGAFSPPLFAAGAVIFGVLMGGAVLFNAGTPDLNKTTLFVLRLATLRQQQGNA